MMGDDHYHDYDPSTMEEDKDTLGPLREMEMEARIECMKAKGSNPQMFVSGFNEDDQGIEEAEDPDLPGEHLLKAAEEGNVDLIIKLLEEDPNIVHYEDRDKYTALHRAAYSDHAQVIRFLVSKGANVEKGTEDGWTPIHCACHWNSYKALRELINSKGNVNAKTNGGQTPLHIASNQQSRECMIILITHADIDITIKNNLGETAKELAERSGKFGHLFEMFDEENHIFPASSSSS